MGDKVHGNVIIAIILIIAILEITKKKFMVIFMVVTFSQN